jgi:hypothetical protein
LSDVFAERLREGSVVLGAGRVEELRGAVERLAAPRLGLDDTLARVRFAFLLPEREFDRERVLGAVNREGELVPGHGADQLLAVLCSCALIEFFAYKEPSRSPAVVRRLTIAALAVRTLAASGLRAAHPDVLSWAGYWLGLEGRRLRELKRSSPPKLAIAADDGEEMSVEQARAAELSRLEDYATATGDWLELTAGAGSIEALREQSQILWWMAGGDHPEDAGEGAVRAAIELASVSLVPPPPASRELIRRRLSATHACEVSPEEFEQFRLQRQTLMRAAEVIPELTPLLATGIEAGAEQAWLAHTLYEELLLADLAGEERRQEEERRLAREAARKRAQEQAAGQQSEEAPQ